MKVVTVYPNFKNQGGAQNIALLLARSLNEERPVVLTLTPLEKIDFCYQAKNVVFETFTIRNVWKYRTCVFLSHSRNTTTFLCLINLLLFHSLHIVHIAHSLFFDLRLFTLFPTHIVAVSHAVEENLRNYFRLRPERIKVIFNGLEDKYDPALQKESEDSMIRVLFAGRICKVKQQIKFVLNAKGRLDERIHIYFAGVGKDRETLEKSVEGDSHFHILGQINMMEGLYRYDYMLLFSEKEGLPVTLIEGCMFGKPLITNDIPSVLDVNEPGSNGFVYKNWADLMEGLNQLPARDTEEYKRLSSRSRQKYLAEFKLSTMVEKYKSYMKELKE